MAAKVDPQEVLMQHGEKIALLVALIVAGAVVAMAGGGDAKEAAASIENSMSKIKGKMGKGVPEDAKPKVPDPLGMAKAPWTATNAKMPADLPWTYYRQPTVKITRTFGPPPVVVTEMAKTGIRCRSTRERIEVEWDRPPSSGKDQDGVSRSAANLLGFELHKWRKGQEGKIQKIFLSGGNTTYSDKEFEPESTYMYKIRAYFEYERPGANEHKASVVMGGRVDVVNGGDSQGSKVRFTQWTNAASATTALNISLTYRSRLGDEATMYVWQFWKGSWWRMKFKVKLGESVGAMISPKQLCNDKYNKSNRSSDAAYQELQKSADKDKATIAWKSGFTYLGFLREKRVDYVLLEHQEVKMRGIFGLDWGQKNLKLAKSTKEEAPE